MIARIGGFIVHKVDYGIGALAISTPAWVEFFEDSVKIYVLLAGAFIITVRALIAFREWKRKS